MSEPREVVAAALSLPSHSLTHDECLYLADAAISALDFNDLSAKLVILYNTLDARDKQVTELYNELQWYKESYSQLDQRIMQALRRYDHDENARQGKGFPRGEVAWAMASDLRPTKKETPA